MIRYHTTIPKIKVAGRGLMNDLVYYLMNYEITEEQAQHLENTGAAHVAQGASGGMPRTGNIAGIVGHDPSVAWMMLMPGPGNCWIETVEGNCPACGCRANLHIKKYRDMPDLTDGKWSLPSTWNWGTLCTCGCRRDIPHGSIDKVLGLTDTLGTGILES